MSAVTSFKAYLMAMERLELRLRSVTAALESNGIPYAVIGGNAVAAWVARVDPSATRTTKDVDLLVSKADLDRITETLSEIGFRREDLRSLVIFIDPHEPSRKSGVHLVWAEGKVRPSYLHPAPSLDEVVRDPSGFWVVDLPALLRMKLTSLRDLDRVHVRDLLDVGLIDEQVRSSLPADLRVRLHEIEASRLADDLDELD